MEINEQLMKMNLYRFLNCKDAADESEIRRAFRKKSLTCHPDKHPDKPKAVEMFKMLNGAVEILTDPKLRACYDRRRMARMITYSQRWSGLDYSSLKKEIAKRAASPATTKFSAENLRQACMNPDLSPSKVYIERDANRRAREERLKRQSTNEFPSCYVQSPSQKTSEQSFCSNFPSTRQASTSRGSTNFTSMTRKSTEKESSDNAMFEGNI